MNLKSVFISAFVATASSPSGVRVQAKNVNNPVASPGNGPGVNNGNGNGPKEVGPNDNISEFLRKEYAQGNKKAKLKITTTQGGNGNGGGKPFEVYVVEASAAVTPETLVKYSDGHVQPVGDMGYALLVTDTTVVGDTGDVTILSVNLRTDEVQGVIAKNGQKNMKFNQSKGKPSFVEEEEDWAPPEWACGVNEKIEGETSRSSKNGLFDRRALVDTDSDHDYEEHNHQDHDGHDHHHHNHEDLTMESLRKSLRGSNIQLGERRRLQAAPYSYQVDLYIQVDSLMKNAMTQAGAVAYINTLFSAANQVYEFEIDTHLNVAQIEFTTMYDGASSTNNALDILRNNHQTHPGWNSGVDLYHVLMKKDLGGGIAYLGVLCNSGLGYGVSASLQGNFASIGATVVWDLMVVMHEIGHNFNSPHTHDYSPVVDNCGTSCSPNPPTGSATLMSYCHLCGGYGKMRYTFGGEYDGTGSRTLASNWINNAAIAAIGFSADSYRVPKRMYDHVSSKGTCVAIPNNPTPSPTPLPTPSPTPNVPTKLPTKAPTQPPVVAPTPAVYDIGMGAPRCTAIVSSCNSGSLLVGRGSMSNGEPNNPNTVDTCTDGNAGLYGSDESIDRIVVRSADGSPLKAGFPAIIEATVYAWSTGSYDYADFYYSTDANILNWQLVGRQKPLSGGFSTLSQSFNLVSGSSTQAVRVVFKYSTVTGNAAVPCPGGTYDDVDDLVFSVSMQGVPTKMPTPMPTPSPTKQPTKMPTNNPTSVGVTQMAVFDAVLKVPKCNSVGVSCDSGSALILGRANIPTGGAEPNQPNSLDSCTDGTSGTFHTDESIDRIIVKTVDGTNLAPGKVAKIEASVWAWDTGLSDSADFYYASSASINPVWQFLGTVVPSVGGNSTVAAQFTVQSGGTIQAVRVNFRYGGSGGTGCAAGSWNDVDDLAFAVA